jgi:cytochrome oxidase assembly protein ShyY1
VPAWVIYTIIATAALFALAVALGAWLLWRDRRRLRTAADRLEGINASLCDPGSRLARLGHDLRETLNQMRWGRGPGP